MHIIVGWQMPLVVKLLTHTRLQTPTSHSCFSLNWLPWPPFSHTHLPCPRHILSLMLSKFCYFCFSTKKELAVWLHCRWLKGSIRYCREAEEGSSESTCGSWSTRDKSKRQGWDLRHQRPWPRDTALEQGPCKDKDGNRWKTSNKGKRNRLGEQVAHKRV